MTAVASTYTSRFRDAFKRTAQSMYDMCLCASEVHERYGYQSYVEWLNVEFGLSRQTGDNLLNVYRNIISTPNFSVNNIMGFAKSALYLLAQASTPPEARQAALDRAMQGEEITRPVATQIVRAYQLAAAVTNNPYPPTLAIRGSHEVIKEAEETGNVTLREGKQVPVTSENLQSAASATIQERAARQRQHIEDNKSRKIFNDSGPLSDVLARVASALGGTDKQVRIVIYEVQP